MSKYVPFKTKKKSGFGSIKKNGIIFFAGVALVLVLSCLVILAKNDFDVSAALGGNAETTTHAEEETTEYVEPAEKTFLFWCSNSKTGDMEFLWVARVEYPERKVTVISPAFTNEFTYKGNSMPILNIYSSYGAEGLKSAAEETLGVKIDAYIGSETETFKRMINYFGSVTVNLEDNVEYGGDFNLILMKGENVLKGDMLYKYLVYLGKADKAGAEMRADVLNNIFTSVFTSSNYEIADTIYSKIANLLKTDITIVGYSTNVTYIRQIFENGVGSYKSVEEYEDFA